MKKLIILLDSKGFAHIAAPLIVIAVFAIAGVGFLVASHANPPYCFQRKALKLGSKGECVKAAQFIINDAPNGKGGHLKKLKTDGKFGATTQEGVKLYQQAWGIASDGVVGVGTWHKMCDDYDYLVTRTSGKYQSKAAHYQLIVGCRDIDEFTQ